MLALSGRAVSFRARLTPQMSAWGSPRQVFRLRGAGESPCTDSFHDAWLLDGGSPPPGVNAYVRICRDEAAQPSADVPSDAALLELPASFAHLRPGDIVAVSTADARVRVLYRRNSAHNSFLVTERCDHYCLMCSQPPKDIDDSWIVDEILEALPLVDPSTQEIGFTGGEPTLLGDRFIDVLTACRDRLPNTAVHVLSNGRRFADKRFALSWAGIHHPDLMVGIPLYSDLSTVHDYVVQSDGAYDATVRGILNLKELRQQVELRVVLHKQTVSGLVRFAEFIARNLLFLDHVALMGLEITGFTRANLPALWIDPYDYQTELAQAVSILASAGMRISIYNHPLCLIPEQLWPFAVKSISDWKNEFHTECEGCGVREACGGFFTSATNRRSEHIRALRAEAMVVARSQAVRPDAEQQYWSKH